MDSGSDTSNRQTNINIKSSIKISRNRKNNKSVRVRPKKSKCRAAVDKVKKSLKIDHKGRKEFTKGDMLKLFIIFMLDATSCADYIVDLIVLSQLFERHPAWFTLSLYFIISPFIVSYVPLINF